MDNLTANNSSHDSSQQKSACHDELLCMVEKLHDYISTLSVSRLRNIPEFDEVLHLNLSLEAYYLRNKYRPQLAKPSTARPSLMCRSGFDKERRFVENLVTPKDQDTSSTHNESSLTRCDTSTPFSADSEQFPLSLATHSITSVNLGLGSPTYSAPIDEGAPQTVASDDDHAANNENDDDDIQIVQETIASRIGSDQPFRKTNRGFYYNIKHKNGKSAYSEIAQYVLKEHPDEQGIVFCSDEKEAAILQNAFDDKISVCRLSNASNEQRWVEGKVKVLLCTSSLPKAKMEHKVGFLIHATLPTSIKSFIKKLQYVPTNKGIVDCVIYYTRFDLYKFKSLFTNDDEKARKRRQGLYNVASFCESSSCRKLYLRKVKCQSIYVSCDNCFNGVSSHEIVNVSDEAKEILKRLIKHGNQTINQLASRDKSRDKQTIRKILSQLILRGYLNEMFDGTRYPKVVLTTKGHEAIAKPDDFEIMIERQKTFDEEDDQDLDEDEFNAVKRIKVEKADNDDVNDDMQMRIQDSYSLQRSNPSRSLSFEDSDNDLQEG